MRNHIYLDERKLLVQLRHSKSSTLVSLRSALAWEVARFVTTLVALQERGLVAREGINLSLTDEGAKRLQQASREPRLDKAEAFISEVEAPKLPVNSLYLPDHGRFLRAVQRSLYTQGVSRVDPE